MMGTEVDTMKRKASPSIPSPSTTKKTEMSITEIMANPDEWMRMLEHLLYYRNVVSGGDLNVPEDYVVPGSNAPLGAWVTTQRRLYHEKHLSADHAHILNEIGFDWTVGSQARQRGEQSDEVDKSDELVLEI